jgi:class 3 adenylate cyclase/tetratricopeptide (TPR) repeat protein
MPTFLETLASYVPTLIVRQTQPAPLDAPMLERFDAAILFADISGFTTLTERLAKQGPEGVEELTKYLNAYFGQLITLITEHGGDVIKFAGDALLALWPAIEEDLTLQTMRAAQCSLVILKELGDYVAGDVHLTLHMGIAAGETIALRVGGVQGRWEFLVAGQPLVQMASAEAHAQKGEVCISPEGWALIQDKFSGTILESGDVRLDAVRESVPTRRAEVPVVVPEMAAALRGYIPWGILERLDAGQTQWLAELRCVTVLFGKLPDLDYAAIGFLEQVQQAMQAMQRAVYQYEGTIRQLIVDDKGCVLVAAFGLPPIAHEDDAERAIRSALAMRDNLGKLGLTSAIGITTGYVYCGSVGSNTRCEYAMVGDIVNLAARLMMVANNEVLCDRKTIDAAQGRLMFESCPPIRVKGKAEPVAIYRPSSQAPLTCLLRMPIVGRKAEKTLLAEKLERLHKEGVGGVVAIEGEPGIGKSRLVEDLIEQALSLGVTSLRGAGDAIEKSTPYFAWRGVFSQLLELDVLSEPESRRFSYPAGTPTAYGDAARSHVLAQLESATEWLPLAPLLNALLPLNLPENDLTGQLSGKVRADNTHNLLLHLLQISVKRKHEAKPSPKLLILEDAHWMDSASWALTRLIAGQVEPLLLVIATRPLTETTQEDYLQFLHTAGTLYIQIEALPDEDTLALVCQRLRVNSLPEPVAALIRSKAQGNPFFSEELAYALRDAGLIAIADGECRLTTDLEEFSAFVVPDNIQGVITSRLDRLTPMQALTLKVASVIGRVFAFRLLRDIHPIEADQVHIAEYLHTLAQLDITPLETPDPNLAYSFKHIITQEVAYNLMLFSHRRQLHYAVAQWYEQNHTDDLSPFYPVLAHHWSHAVEPGRGWSISVLKAIDYFEKAGEQALRAYSLQEAVRFFSQALSLVSVESKVLISESDSTNLKSFIQNLKSREALWQRYLGEAFLGLGQLPESREHLARAVVLLGRPMPTTGPRLWTSLLWQVLRQTLHRLGYIPFQSDYSAARTTLLETARIYDLLAEIYYHANEIVAAIYAALRTLNLAERAGPTPELARAYASSCFATGVIPLHPLAEAYSRRAREIAESLEHLPALARVLIVTSAYSLGVGQWDKTQKALDKAVEICKSLGDRHEWGNCLAILAKSAYFQGQFSRGVELWTELYTMAHRSGDILHQAWGLNGQAEGLLRLGDVNKAVSLLEESLLLFAQNNDRVSQTATYGMLAIARLYQGEQELALKTASVTRSQLEQLSSPNSYYLIQGYAGVAQVYLALWEADLASNWDNRLSDSGVAINVSARQACKALHRYARIFPVGKPLALLYQGVFDWLGNQPTRARFSWRRSLAAAYQLGMPYEQGLVHYQMGRHATDSEREQHLKSACEIFSSLGTVDDLARASAALVVGK